MKLSEGKQMALRRDALGWTQADFAKVADVSPSTVARAEGDDPKVTPAMKSALWRAIEKEEAQRGTGPDLSTPSGTTEPSMKEGAADVLAAIQETRHKLDNHLTLLLGAVEGIRRDMADLDARAQAAQSARKPA